MASEPRNYPDYVFVAYDEDFSAQTYDIAVSLEPGNLVGRPVKYIRHDLNTRPAPAATDTGLETVGRKERSPHGVHSSIDLPEGTELVTRSQAVELLAAERAKTERWHKKAMDAGVITHSDGTTSHPMRKELDGLKADNAAKDARINFLERIWKKAESRAEALEAKLAAAQEALEPFALISSEGVIKQETGHVTVITCAEYFHKARAVLGGKPS